MRAYFDSSVIVSLLLQDSHFEKAKELWSRYDERVSSTLLEIECYTVLRRCAVEFEAKAASDWLEKKIKLLSEYLEEISLKHIDQDILERVCKEDRIDGCRTLDAIHLVTADLFFSVSEEPFNLCTFDQKMKAFAANLQLRTA